MKNLKESSISALAKIKTTPTSIVVEIRTVLYNRCKEKYYLILQKDDISG